MIQIDTINLRNEINTLNSYIDECEEIQLNLFNQLKDSCINWQDGYSQKFDSKMYLEKQKSNEMIQNLKDKVAVYDFVCDEYSSIGKVISCNLDGKNKITEQIDKCRLLIGSVGRKYYDIDFWGAAGYDFETEATRLLDLKEKLLSMKNSTHSTFYKIDKIEKQAKLKIDQLDKFNLDDFEFDI